MQHDTGSSDLYASRSDTHPARYLIETHLLDQSGGRSVDDARLADQGIPVWIIIDFDGTADGDTLAVARAYGISAEAVEAARAFYRRHTSEIDARIAAATAAFA